MASSGLWSKIKQKWAAYSSTLLLALVLIYVIGLAGTWTGIADRSVTLPALAVLGLLVIAWLLTRWQYRNTWHKTPLDILLIFWFIAIAISTAANWSARSNIATGLWFVGLYILVWYMTYDLRANHLLMPDQITNALLLAGLPVLVSTVAEVMKKSIRISGVMQNPNILAAFLILIVILLCERVGKSSSPVWLRAGYAAYLVVALAVLYLTRSRGAFLGVFAGIGAILYVQTRQPMLRMLLLLVGLGIALVLLGIRGDSGRLTIYRRALFFEIQAPFTGQGLFTFRTGGKVPQPDGQSVHAHNAVLQFAVELGPLGVGALFVSLLQLLRTLERVAWPRHYWIGAALIGLLAQQTVDFTIMTPSIALCAVLLYSSVVGDDDLPGERNRWPLLGLGLLTAVLLFAGAVAGKVPLSLLK